MRLRSDGHEVRELIRRMTNIALQVVDHTSQGTSSCLTSSLYAVTHPLAQVGAWWGRRVLSSSTNDDCCSSLALSASTSTTMANNGRVRSRQRSPPSPVRPLCQHTPARRVEQDGSYLATWWDHPDTLALSKALLYVEVEKIAVWGAQVFDEMVANRYTLMSAGLEPDSSVLYLPKSRDNRHTARKAQAETKRWQELVDLEREECRLWEKRYNDREALLPEIEPVSEARNSPVPLLQAQAQARKADARLIKALESSSSAMQKELKDLGRDSEAARKSLEVKLEHARRELTKERERVVELKDLSKLTKTKAEAREQELVDQLQAAQAEVEK